MRLRTGMKVWTNTSNELTTTPNELTTTNEFTITKIIELTEQTGELSNKAFSQGDVLNSPNIHHNRLSTFDLLQTEVI